MGVPQCPSGCLWKLIVGNIGVTFREPTFFLFGFIKKNVNKSGPLECVCGAYSCPHLTLGAETPGERPCISPHCPFSQCFLHWQYSSALPLSVCKKLFSAFKKALLCRNAFSTPSCGKQNRRTSSSLLWAQPHTISGFHALASQPPCFPDWQQETCLPFKDCFSKLARQLISLYRESVSWLLHKLLVQFGGCARRNPLGTFLRWVGVGLPWSLINQQRCRLRLAHNNSSPASYKFCWNSKHYLPLVQKEGPFWGPSNIHSCLLCARQDVIRLPMQFTTWVRICDFLKSQGQEYF